VWKNAVATQNLYLAFWLMEITDELLKLGMQNCVCVEVGREYSAPANLCMKYVLYLLQI
jgi:hypothetical protein